MGRNGRITLRRRIFLFWWNDGGFKHFWKCLKCGFEGDHDYNGSIPKKPLHLCPQSHKVMEVVKTVLQIIQLEAK